MFLMSEAPLYLEPRRVLEKVARGLWRSNPSRKCSQERLTRGIVTSTMRRAGHPSGCARCGAGADCSASRYQSI